MEPDDRARSRIRRAAVAVTAVSVAAALFPLSAARAGAPSAVVVVRDPSRLTPVDQAIVDRLDDDYDVSVRDDAAPVPPTGPDVVVLARSAAPGAAARYRTTRSGVVSLNPHSWDELRLTTAAGPRKRVRAATVTLVRPRHPVARRAANGDYADEPLALGYALRSRVASGVQVIARAVDRTPRRIVIASARTGAMLAGGIAAGRRVAFGLRPGTTLRASGWSLFDGAVRWASQARTDDPPPPNGACQRSTERVCIDPELGFVAVADPTRRLVLNGVNLQDAVEANWHYDLAPLATPGSPDFDTLRIALNWPIFEPARGQFPSAQWARLDELIAQADQLGYHVILDPIHLRKQRVSLWNVHPGSTWNIPGWAWSGTGIPVSNEYGKESQPTYNCGVEDVLRTEALPYLQSVTARYADNDAVIAIDMVNEPRNSCWGGPGEADSAAAAAQELLDLQLGWADQLRAIDADKILVIEPMYGDFDPTRLNLSGLRTRANLAWTIHDYYAGRGPAYRDSGAADESSERANLCGTSCYDPALAPRPDRRAAMAAVLARHEQALGPVGVPVLVGEYGFHLQATHLVAAFEDKFTVYEVADISRVAWIANYDTPGFALYHEGTDSWDVNAALLTGGALRP